ncbi:hypothetical protein CcaverHIS002_0509560 [Cutaneotrichosporon cavernicola]|uniref:RNI-like protein n=1 Tax=Cutaneotrichosporon cavernicola TaxID=279322 RepID=A0AA48L7G7_9TREE|nr:uncharacterized protein CcaverHIS019_0510120 [Cutaneotrichosporon cavernicola]BEI85555.1 hypothetical protein CcaverHIS002_0509560 [Cutaneotrichosporon cavernicola]BEI93384.1 hypothetical protein CcaverHIS019_0510120 [Cutaneotrichosporon cavernicola]BEJ01162.1 hypothetical protein CcaverHIS631_0510190 [Cutaneotrichosporon cavernicola]BEJ08930.1 hypothetical protein CcaverHIS641_0510240 [Cutaneotrichosporon cavernicola]
MPKHALTFKHLLGTVSTQRGQTDSLSVNDLLERSRASSASRPSKEPPPHLVWTPGNSGPDSTGVHPAELLRREQQAHAYAARRVAGPAPPRSWRQRDTKAPDRPVVAPEQEANELELAAAETFLGHPPRIESGPPRLVDICSRLTLQLLRDDTVVWDEDGERVTMAEAVRAGVAELDLHLRGALLSASALLPPASPLRLADGDIRVLLDEAFSREEEEDEWDTEATRPTLHHLPLMAHPAPMRLLRDIPRFTGLTLTSLDLGFCALPPLERLVAALPSGLRALGIAGVRAAPKTSPEWERGLGALARKMIVLKTLDVSYFPLGTRATVAALFPVRTSGPQVLPSLRALRLLGNDLDGNEDDVPARRKALRATVIDGAGHWVDVRFE